MMPGTQWVLYSVNNFFLAFCDIRITFLILLLLNFCSSKGLRDKFRKDITSGWVTETREMSFGLTVRFFAPGGQGQSNKDRFGFLPM